MKEERILRVLGEIDEQYIEEAAPGRQVKNRPAWMKWGALAACLLLIAAFVLPKLQPAHTKEKLNNLAIVTDEPILGTPDNLAVENGGTSDTYKTLPELLSYLSEHDRHENRMQDGSGSSILSTQGEANEAEQMPLIENTGVAVNMTRRYAYHIGENAVYISRLDGQGTKNVGIIDISATALFVCNSNLLIVSQYQSGGDELDVELSVRVSIYDISNPEKPVLRDEYTQLGSITACWMHGANLYLATNDGVCACGWSRLKDTSGYYPALSHNGEAVPWGDEDISILGQPTSVQYCAITVINGNSREVSWKEALYGNIQKLFYGGDWLAASVASETEDSRENPILYTFDPELTFTGKISVAQMMNVPGKNSLVDFVPQDGTYLGITSVSKAKGVYRILGACSVFRGEEKNGYFMAATADMRTGKANIQLLSSKEYPYGSYTEILWEEERAIVCVGITNHALTPEMEQETRFLIVTFDGHNIEFCENELRADYLDGRVGETFGNPLGAFETLIPMGRGLYVRYTKMAEGPGGFAVFDFADSRAPRHLFASDFSLSGKDAFDYVWYVYDNRTFGTLKVTLGPEDYFRDVALSWCIFSVDPSSELTVKLQQRFPLGETVKTFFGADAIGFAVFEAGGRVYYVTRNMTAAGCIG